MVYRHERVDSIFHIGGVKKFDISNLSAFWEGNHSVNSRPSKIFGLCQSAETEGFTLDRFDANPIRDKLHLVVIEENIDDIKLLRNGFV